MYLQEDLTSHGLDVPLRLFVFRFYRQCSRISGWHPLATASRSKHLAVSRAYPTWDLPKTKRQPIAQTKNPALSGIFVIL